MYVLCYLRVPNSPAGEGRGEPARFGWLNCATRSIGSPLQEERTFFPFSISNQATLKAVLYPGPDDLVLLLADVRPSQVSSKGQQTTLGTYSVM